MSLFACDGPKGRLIADRSTGREYTKADSRWGTADPTIISLEILTVFGVVPLCCYVIGQLMRNDPARHYWIIVLSTAELYGGYGSLSTPTPWKLM